MILCNTLLQPIVLRLKIGFKSVLRITLKVGNIEPVGRKLVHIGEQFPGVGNCLFLVIGEPGFRVTMERVVTLK